LDHLIATKKSYELEIENLTTFLTTGQGAKYGLNKPLVDQEGFPESDVDLVISVRQARNKLAHLKTDIRDIMSQIESELHSLHAASNHHSKNSSTNVSNGPARKEAYDDAEPFVMVDEIRENSPAQLSGLQDGDKVLQFGSVGPFTRSSLQLSSARIMEIIAQVVKDSENSSIPVVVSRKDQRENLTLVPRKGWGGLGLVGCRLSPLPK